MHYAINNIGKIDTIKLANVSHNIVKEIPLFDKIDVNNSYQMSNLFYSKKKNIDYLFLHINMFDKGVLINPYKLPLLNTVILLLSGAYLTLSHKLLRIDRFLYAIYALMVTIFLALSFIGCQIYEYTYAGFSLSDGIYGSLFFMLTGFHGFHVVIGTIFLIVCLGKFLSNHFTRTDHVAFECAI
jgi:heme/copper-type cytochrome/quinol oxidase subunit 3